MVYNTKIFEYPLGVQVRMYNKPVCSDDNIIDDIETTEEIEKKSNILTEEQKEKHCKEVSKNRTKNKIYELTRANTWDYFITFTFNPEKVDRTNYELCVKKVTNWLQHQKKDFDNPDLKYIFVPELHKDGKSWHFHGLISNWNDNRLVDSGHKDKGNIIYNIDNYNFGFSTATKVKDTERVAFYITKYITKEIDIILKNKKRYFASRNLNKPTITNYNFNQDMIAYLKSQCGLNANYMKSLKITEAHQEINYYELSLEDFYSIIQT